MNATCVELQWASNKYATVVLHASKNDEGMLVTNPLKRIMLDASTEDLAWSILKCFGHGEDTISQPAILPDGSKIAPSLWIPLKDKLMTVLEVYQLGVPIPIE